MKLTKKEAPIVVPPPTFVLELTRDEADALWAISRLTCTIPDAIRASYKTWEHLAGPAADLLRNVGVALTDAGVRPMTATGE